MIPDTHLKPALAGEAERRIEAQRAHPPKSNDSGQGDIVERNRRILRRGPWEMAATIIIGLGVVMLMQPFALSLFTYSFVTILAGTVMFIIVSHFPD
ncbi:hypothetical protein H2509_05980 [Stappia sp. F7233]|uniref:Uncharacterized protein n=1 Tax=Stappia albiluteola TaxID=2758565 RepID=A0A839AAS0_9HYPH|nr:hypothetical protein [Stappia albiluteola]MBA5776673.1 hypothetical protein [Stappia albiluteola]